MKAREKQIALSYLGLGCSMKDGEIIEVEREVSEKELKEALKNHEKEEKRREKEREKYQKGVDDRLDALLDLLEDREIIGKDERNIIEEGKKSKKKGGS